MKKSKARATKLLVELHAEANPIMRAELADRYGIHTKHAVGIAMRRLQEIAAPLRPDHELAAELWSSGLYEARVVAALVDDPAMVDADQMDRWCADFDNWAIVDTVCFQLFDKTADAWSRVSAWAMSEGEFTKRAGFALLWALALHDRGADDDQFRGALTLIELNAGDERRLVGSAQTMALRAIARRRPQLTSDVLALARRLAESPDRQTRRVGRPILAAFDD